MPAESARFLVVAAQLVALAGGTAAALPVSLGCSRLDRPGWDGRLSDGLEVLPEPTTLASDAAGFDAAFPRRRPGRGFCPSRPPFRTIRPARRGFG